MKMFSIDLCLVLEDSYRIDFQIDTKLVNKNSKIKRIDK